MSSQPSRTEVTKQQPTASLKNRSVFLMISLITFCDRRKGCRPKQDIFDLIFIILRKFLVSDFYSTAQSCEQSCNTYQKVSTYLPLSALSLHEDRISSAHRTPLPCTYFLSLKMFVFPPFQEAKQWEGHSVNVISWPSFFHVLSNYESGTIWREIH